VPVGEVLERGDVFFLYRPKVDTERVGGLDDVQGLYLVLEPEGDGPFRRIEVGRKALPPPAWAGRRHGWAFVAEVTERGEELGAGLGREEYETKTRGRRVQPEDRPLAEGRYALVRAGDDVLLEYALDAPEEPGPPQEAMGVLAERAFAVRVKDPTKQSPGQRSPTSGRTEPLPDALQRRFGAERFVALDPPGFLDHEGVELLLMPAGEAEDDVEVQAEPGEELDLFDDLGVEREALPTGPLERGEWA
jgi:hypothetical protein